MRSSHLLHIGRGPGAFMRCLAASALLASLFAGTACAEDIPPFNINMDRVEFNHEGDFADSKTYFIPTVYLRVMARTQTTISSQGSSGASVKAKIFIDGMDKTLFQGLAKKVYDDLVAKIRAAGYTVLTYDDLKSEMTGMERMKANEKYGFPTKLSDGASGIDFAIVTPSDEQAFDYGLTGIMYGYRGIAKSKDVVVLVPDIHFSITEVAGSTDSNIWGKSASLAVLPPMRLYGATVNALPPDASWGDIRILQHGTRLAAEVAGTVAKVSEDRNDYAGWARSTADYTFTLDPVAVSTGILRVGYAINDLTVKTIKDEH